MTSRKYWAKPKGGTISTDMAVKRDFDATSTATGSGVVYKGWDTFTSGVTTDWGTATIVGTGTVTDWSGSAISSGTRIYGTWSFEEVGLSPHEEEMVRDAILDQIGR